MPRLRSAAAPVGPGDGGRVGLGLLGDPRQDPQQVGEAVQVGEDLAAAMRLVVAGEA